MAYAVKEIFYTLQGEGANAGRPAVFCRFAGCNLWSGRASDRSEAVCNFCDTDFVGTDGPGGGKFADATALAAQVLRHWPVAEIANVSGRVRRLVVLTGGEPALQVDEALIDALHARGFEVAIETNGTLPLPRGLDWICVSPKAGTSLQVTSGNELKLVYPQLLAPPERFAALDFQHFLLQPMDGLADDSGVGLAQRARHTQAALRYCLTHPQWRLSLQTHKLLGIP